MQEPVIKAYLKSRDLEAAVSSMEDLLKTVSKDTLCLLLITKTLDKSGEQCDVECCVVDSWDCRAGMSGERKVFGMSCGM